MIQSLTALRANDPFLEFYSMCVKMTQNQSDGLTPPLYDAGKLGTCHGVKVDKAR